MNANPTRLSTRSNDSYTWPVVEQSRWEVQVCRGGYWIMVGVWHDKKSVADADATRQVRHFGADNVRVIMGGWYVLRNATEADMAV